MTKQNDRKMKVKLLFLILLLFPISIMAEDTGGQIELKRCHAPKEHSEVPVDVNVDDKQISIYIHDEIDWATVDIYGQGASTMFDIESAMPGEVYQIDMTDFPSGGYDITIFTDGDTLNGSFEL